MKQIHLIGIALLLSACFSTPAPAPTVTIAAPFIVASADNPYAPRAEDINKQIGGVILTSQNLAEQIESDPARVKLNISGSLPRACNELRMEVADPNEQYQIHVDVYSLVDPDVKCQNVFQQFEAAILLGVYSVGRYTVWVNNELVGDFVSNQ